MSSRMRVTKGHSGNRRSHHALKAPRLSECSNCGSFHERHRVCKDCGFYRGKAVLTMKEEPKATAVESTKEETPVETLPADNSQPKVAAPAAPTDGKKVDTKAKKRGDK